MNKSSKIILSLLTMLILLLLTTIVAAADMNDYADEIPEGMVLITSEHINPNLPMDPQNYYLPEKGDVSILSSFVFPGAATSDSSQFGPSNDGLTKIYSQVDEADGFWDGVFFSKFSGYGQTKWSGAVTPTTNTAEVKVYAYGFLPYISKNGLPWQILSSSTTVGEKTTNNPSTKDTKSFYSNIKIQNITSLAAVFTNYSYLNLPGLGGYSSSEDTWWWW